MKEEIDISDALGNKVSGILSIPEDASSVVILSHGFSSSKERKKYRDFEHEFNLLGAGTLRYDYYGHGTNYGNKYGVSEDTTLTKTVESLKAMIKYLRKENSYKIGLVGSSFGGLISLIAASQDKNITAIGLISPVVEPAKLWKERIEESFGKNGLKLWEKKGIIHYNSRNEEFYLRWDFWKDLQKYDVLGMAKKISCPTLIVHGDRDKVVPISQSRALAKILGIKVRVVKGADHNYKTKKQYAEMKTAIKDFMLDML